MTYYVKTIYVMTYQYIDMSWQPYMEWLIFELKAYNLRAPLEDILSSPSSLVPVARVELCG